MPRRLAMVQRLVREKELPFQSMADVLEKGEPIHTRSLRTGCDLCDALLDRSVSVEGGALGQPTRYTPGFAQKPFPDVLSIL